MITAKQKEAEGDVARSSRRGGRHTTEAVAGLAGLGTPFGLEPTPPLQLRPQGGSQAALSLRQPHSCSGAGRLARGWIPNQTPSAWPLLLRGGVGGGVWRVLSQLERSGLSFISFLILRSDLHEN